MFKSFFKNLKNFAFNFPWLIVLLGILIAISSTSFKPNFYLSGWDNFSSYLNVPLNLERTILSPWRQYRGLGVASDSEVVDVFHQVFTGIFSFILSKELLDQVYLLFSFILGSLLMYLFAYKLFRYIFPPPVEKEPKTHLPSLHKCADLFAFLAAFFYIFNLNTLSVFYFPMLPYTSRFFVIPAMHLFLLWFLTAKKFSKKGTILFILLGLFSSVSYITATIFITILISLFIHGLGYLKIKRAAIFFLILLGLNMFWLLPFGNYTLQKAPIISLTPSNIEGNESLLNKSYDFFSAQKQLVFYSNFFEMNYINPESNSTDNFHPQTADFLNPIYFIFPTAFLVGLGLITLFIMTNYRKNRLCLNLFWIPLHTLIFIFLSFKETGPTGAIYKLISDTIPLFDIVFRFGDAKFHAFVVFGASLLAAFGIVYLTSFIPPFIFKRFLKSGFMPNILSGVLVLALIIMAGWGFRSYFTGNFVGSFMHTQIPNAYFQMAEVINKDTSNVRVLHLPMDKYSYWRPFSWGYYGSSFFHFLINKPYLDKTFEVASLENNYLNTKIYALSEHLENLTEEDKRQTAAYLAETLREANIKYLILDETIGSTNIAQDKKYISSLSFEKAQIALFLLRDYGLIKEHSKYQITPSEHKNYSTRELDREVQNLAQTVYLFEVIGVDERIDFATNSKRIDPNLDYLAQTGLFPVSDNQVLLQSTLGAGYELQPFLRRDAKVSQISNEIIYTLPKTSLSSGNYTVKTDPNIKKESRVVKLLAKRNQDVLVVSVYEVVAPGVQDHNFERLIGDAIIPLNELPGVKLNDLRLRLDEVVLTLPENLNDQGVVIGYVLTSKDQVELELLQKDQVIPVATSTFQAGTPTDCLNTRLESYQAYVEGVGNGVNVEAKNGSVCVISEIGKAAPKELAYAELTLNITGRSTDLDSEFGKDLEFTPSPLQRSITDLPKPVNAYFCLERNGLPPCFNPNQYVLFHGQKRVVLPLERQLIDTSGLRFIFALRNLGYQRQQAVLENVQLNTFKVASSYRVDLKLEESFSKTIAIDNTKELTIKLPKPKSAFSSLNNAQSYNMNLADAPCEDKKGFRTIRESGGKIVTFTRKCGTGLFFSLPTSDDLMYIWLVDYNLLSGQFPNMRIYDEVGEYFSERASLYQGYPRLKDFRSFGPQSKLTDQDFEQLNTHSAYYILHSNSNLRRDLGKAFSLTQYSDNDGIVAIDSFNLVGLPKHWGSLSVTPNSGTTQKYQKPSKASLEKVIPGIWRVKIAENSPQGRYLLEFKEGFDKQWSIYSSKGDLVLNNKAGVNNRCNRLFNCFEFSLTEPTTREKTYYLFYEPIKLSILGAFISLITIIAFFFDRRLKI